MDWRTASSIALGAAQTAHARLGIDPTRRIDVFDAIEKAGLMLAFFPLRRASGAYLRQPGAPSGVLVNSQHPLSRQRYTAAHELGHHEMEHATTFDEDFALLRGAMRTATDEEKQADAFAAWFLMPRPLVRRLLREMGVDKPRSAEQIYDLALAMGTSYRATCWHMVDLKLATLDQARAWASVELRGIKLALADEQAPDSLRNDVWALDELHAGRELFVREGDRLIIRLTETPSTGYRWQLHEAPPRCSIVAEALAAADGEEQSERAIEATRSLVVSVDGEVTDGVLVLHHTRPWEDDPAERFFVHIDTEPARVGIPECKLALPGAA